jgi:hypothetical protein
LFFFIIYPTKSFLLLGQPGKAALWLKKDFSTVAGREFEPLPVPVPVNINYDTKAATVSQLPNLVNSYTQDNSNSKVEIQLILTSSDDRSPFSHSSIKQAISSSFAPVIYPTLYQDGNSKTALDSVVSKDTRKFTLNEFIDHVKANSDILSDNKVDIFQITLSGHESEHENLVALTNIQDESSILHNVPVLFMTIEEPATDSSVPTNYGYYKRFLAISSNLYDGIYYKPEGAEYSIYYANTYLYITPDIFTGSLVGIFMIFVLLTGYSCLNGIQTNDLYASKACPVGKEA